MEKGDEVAEPLDRCETRILPSRRGSLCLSLSPLFFVCRGVEVVSSWICTTTDRRDERKREREREKERQPRNTPFVGHYDLD